MFKNNNIQCKSQITQHDNRLLQGVQQTLLLR